MGALSTTRQHRFALTRRCAFSPNDVYAAISSSRAHWIGLKYQSPVALPLTLAPAPAGSFTTALLARDVRRVYAVDVGVGQLVGRLRSDDRVINLEGHNLALVDSEVISESVEVLTIDVGYLPLTEALPQIERLRIGAGAHLVALVKPTFELRRATLATSDRDIDAATSAAVGAIQKHSWRFLASCPAPTTGRGGAREVFLHACRWR